MEQKQTEQLKFFIEKMENKDFKLYFFTLDTKGNPTAGIANIYEHVKILRTLGYNASILHEKKDYKLHGDDSTMGLSDWLGSEYAELPHACIENQDLNITPIDFIIIPEIFANLMDQVKAFPCRKVVFSQNYDYLLELLPLGKRWDVDFGFTHVITTTKKQEGYLKNLFPTIKTSVIPVAIPEFFKPSEVPKIPLVTILTRNQGDASRLVKSFYLQYPVYKFVSFRELRGLSRQDFAEQLGKSCLAIWLDDPSSFGTFPLECMQSETPIIGKIPNMVPEWLETPENTIKNNGIWVDNTLVIPSLIATYLKSWFEDSVPQELLDGAKESNGQYTSEKQFEVAKEVYEKLFEERLNEFKSGLETSQNTENNKQEETN